MKVKDILLKKGREVYSVSGVTTVYDAIALMSKFDVGALLVMEKGSLLGIISERDYRNKVILKGRQSGKTRVTEIMTSSVFCVNDDYDIRECMAIMSDQKIRHLPVLDEKGNVNGLISIGDVVKAVIDQQKNEIRDLRQYITSGYPG